MNEITKIDIECQCVGNCTGMKIIYIDDEDEEGYIEFRYEIGQVEWRKTIFEKLKACWRILKHGRLVYHDLIMTRAELIKLREGLKDL